MASYKKDKFVFNTAEANTSNFPQDQVGPQNKKLFFPYSKPQGNNSISALAVLFEDKQYYNDFTVPYVAKYFQNDKLFGDLINSDALHGLIDNDLNVIYPIESYMKQISSFDNKEKFAMDFVADAFNEMNSYLMSSALIGKMSRTSVFYNLKAHRAYVAPQHLIDSVQARYIDGFKTAILNNQEMSAQVVDAKSFNKKFLSYVRNHLKKSFPVTKSSIILSSNFIAFMSGLIIDIAKDKADDDTKKFDKYFSDPDFGCFADACKRFGFKIDGNVPWRIIADLNSPAMFGIKGNHAGYMNRYNIESVDKLYSDRYMPAVQDEIEFLKNFFYKTYNSLLKDLAYYSADHKKLVSCDFNKQTVFSRKAITKEEYSKLYPDTYWLRVYTYLRNYEEQKNFKQQEFENVVREANNFLSVDRKKEALKYVNDYFKEYKNVYYFSSLQAQNTSVQLKAESKVLNELVF